MVNKKYEYIEDTVAISTNGIELMKLFRPIIIHFHVLTIQTFNNDGSVLSYRIIGWKL